MVSLEEELSDQAPMLTAILRAACGHKNWNTSNAYIVMAAAVLLKCRSKHACLLQSLIGIMLYTSHASKSVSIHVQCLKLIHTGISEVKQTRSMCQQ